jgi:succinate dehydrogenase hydrophobic anchor subunit
MSAMLWVLQRASGLLLVFLVGIHLGVHYALFPVSFRRGVLLGVDWLLLGIVLYHGCNGLRTIAHDHLSGPRAQRAADWALVGTGLALFLYGSWGLAAFAR